LDKANRTVVFVGGLDKAHYFKGIPNLLKALTTKDLEKVRAVIVGDGDMRAKYEKLSDDLGLADRVVFTGRVSEEDLPRYYLLGDVFVFPSTDSSEAFGIAALEAMSCGLPVVASDLPGVRTIVRDGETGWRSQPGSVSSFAVSLARLLNDESSLKRFGENARKMAVEEYTNEIRAKKLNRIVNELLG
jgi:glycosyltransferase involved in cell wall biosynthesis